MEHEVVVGCRLINMYDFDIWWFPEIRGTILGSL